MVIRALQVAPTVLRRIPPLKLKGRIMATKRDLIADELRRQINTGELASGSKVAQGVLAQRFETSITPVREAFGLLEAEGMLVSEPHQGVRVATADISQVQTVYLIRQLVEPYVVQRAVWNMSPRDLHVVTSLHEKMAELVDTADADAFNKLNLAFHFAFFERCGDDGLRAEITNLWKRYPWDLLRVLEIRSAQSHEEHAAILDAARCGDLEAVATAARNHIRTGYLTLAERLAGETRPDPFPIVPL